MAKTLGQRLAAQLIYQITCGQEVLLAGGADTENDRTDAVFGSPRDVLTVRGNVADVGLTNVI